MKKWLFILLTFVFIMPAFGQQEDEFLKNTQQDMMIVAAAGAGGAVLGLSTLSFYESPSNHISNIWTGAALGIIGGVIWVAYSSATKTSEDLTNEAASMDFGTGARLSWHQQNLASTAPAEVQFGTSFFHATF